MSSKKINQTYSSILKVSIQVFGILVTIFALMFAIKKTLIIGQSNWYELLNIRILLLMLIGGVFYALDEFFLVLAWQRLLIWFGEPAKLGVCVAVYGRTQLAKYIPGNFFHLPSRHIMGARVGFKHSAQVGAAIYEIIGIIASTGVLTLIGFSTSIQLGNSITWLLTVVSIIILMFLVVQFFLSYFKIGQRFGFPDRSSLDSFKNFSILILYLFFFVFAGIIFWGIVGTTSGIWLGVPIQSIISIFAMSWLSGFLTPGSPAGIGVREAAIILILTSYIGEPAAVLVAIISRLVVTIGDLFFFTLSSFISLTASANG